MRKISIVLAILLALLLASACVQEGDVSKDASLVSESVPQQDESETSADSLVTEEWENTTEENGDTVLRKYTKEYNGDESNYTLTAMKYTNGELTEKIITVYTEGEKTHDETYRYDGDVLLHSDKSDYEPGVSVPKYSHGYAVDEYDSDYAYYEYEHTYSADGAITDGNRTYYTEDGAVMKTEEVSQKELDGYACSYTVTTLYENGVVSGFTHTAEDRNLDYWYVEKLTADGETVYIRKKINDSIIVTFPDVGAYSVSGIEYEIFSADGHMFAKARFENGMLNIYEIAEGVSTQDAINMANAIVAKAREHSL